MIQIYLDSKCLKMTQVSRHTFNIFLRSFLNDLGHFVLDHYVAPL